jgi:Ca2+-transporting ATPase
MRYLVSVHVPIAGMSFVPLLAGWPLVLFPVHVVFFEFVIDPACSIAFEAERSDPHVMERPPRAVHERLFGWRSLLAAIGIGAVMLACVALLYAWALSSGRPEGACRAMAFCAITAGNLALILAHRSAEITIFESFGRENGAVAWILAGTLAALVLAIYVPAAAEVFRFEPLDPRDLAAALAVGALPVLGTDLLKLYRRRTRR